MIGVRISKQNEAILSPSRNFIHFLSDLKKSEELVITASAYSSQIETAKDFTVEFTKQTTMNLLKGPFVFILLGLMLVGSYVRVNMMHNDTAQEFVMTPTSITQDIPSVSVSFPECTQISCTGKPVTDLSVRPGRPRVRESRPQSLSSSSPCSNRLRPYASDSHNILSQDTPPTCHNKPIRCDPSLDQSPEGDSCPSGSEFSTDSLFSSCSYWE